MEASPASSSPSAPPTHSRTHTHTPATSAPLPPPSLLRPTQDVDKNQDGRISADEFARAFSAGGVPGIPGASMLGNPDQVQRMKDAGELDDFTVSHYYPSLLSGRNQ